MHVNSLWQRLRQNLLMFLQLLLVALAMLALMRPGWESAKLDGDRFVFLVDNSASMSATDVDGAKNRLDEAKKLWAHHRSNGLRHAAMIVTFADTPQVVQEFTSTAIIAASVENNSADGSGNRFERRFELADGLANQAGCPSRG